MWLTVLLCVLSTHLVPRLTNAQVATCPDLGVPSNALRNGDGITVGAAVTYTCNDGYALNGAKTLHCRANGTWSGVPPSCDANCILSQWTEWSGCSVTCGDGVRRRQRTVMQEPSGVGMVCGEIDDLMSCKLRDICVPGPFHRHIAGHINCSSADCDGFPVGSSRITHERPTQYHAADIIVIVDESSGMGPAHGWIPSAVSALEDRLVNASFGMITEFRNHYALVGFGRARLPNGSDAFALPHALHNNAGDTIFTIDTFKQAFDRLVADGRIEDGYLAIEYALRNITSRQGKQLLRLGELDIETHVILISNEDRDALQPYGNRIWRSAIKRLVRRSGATLHVVVDQQFHADNRLALGFDSGWLAYFAGDGGLYSTSYHSSSLGHGYGTTHRDYTAAAFELGGTAWDINMMEHSSDAVQSFARAFVDIAFKYISRHQQPCSLCHCSDNGRTVQWECRRARDQLECHRQEDGFE